MLVWILVLVGVGDRSDCRLPRAPNRNIASFDELFFSWAEGPEEAVVLWSRDLEPCGLGNYALARDLFREDHHALGLCKVHLERLRVALAQIEYFGQFAWVSVRLSIVVWADRS